MVILGDVLPIVIYILLIVLITVFIIVGIKIINILNRTNDLVDDIQDKVNTFNSFFDIMNLVNDKVSGITDKAVGLIENLVVKFTKGKKKGLDDEFDDEDIEEYESKRKRGR